ncbi:DUF4232 domain-containing protein [Streptomyces sp. NPDC096136]|uniref:DUF4232 domain-containing protein n=1 Tax=Streptomyces sp. NPDC096136 TaxID=3366076 RepID=UPI00380F2607
MRIHRSRSTALATLVGLALALTACEGGGPSGGGAGAPAPSTTAPQASPTPPATPAPTPTPTASGSTARTAPDGKGTDEAYAYTHPCSARNLSVKVSSEQGLPATVRVIAVTNNGSTGCGLDLHPAVGFSAKGTALGIQATPPEGIGGPAYPVRPGSTAYAAVDLDPSGAAGPLADEINILADPSHMPNADGVSLPLATPGAVARPKVGLYHVSARDSFKTL